MFKELTPEEERVIVNKGTEEAFTGKYDDHYEKGIYICRRCGAKLYESSAKFKSGCGWPSYDDEIPNAVKRLPDADGRRTEILCASCDAHLGHVFLGEGRTPKDTRHCVNSISIEFVPAKENTEKAIFASGCFWGVEAAFAAVNGVTSTTVGYTGGHLDNPTYRDVCHRNTGHAEAVLVEFDAAVVSYEQLLDAFWKCHNPTTRDRQGRDVGSQYRSAIFYHDAAQKKAADASKAKLNTSGTWKGSIVTEVVPAATFWRAEEYHQRYLEKRGLKKSCGL